jgi:hypothetical protein
MKRLMKWNGNDWFHIDTSGEDVCDGEDCISLVDDYPGLSLNQFTWKREVWEKLAEHILSEKKRREEEARPKRWYVSVEPYDSDYVVSVKPAAYHLPVDSKPKIKAYDNGEVCFYLMASGEDDAKAQGRIVYENYLSITRGLA